MQKSKTLTLEVIPGAINRPDPSELETLRSLLLEGDRERVGQHENRLVALEQRLNDKSSRIEDASEVIVPVLAQRLATDEELGQVLQPVIVEQFSSTARNETELMAEALFPVLGPAIRKMIASMLMPDPKARKRTYRVEQLYLIDKETGLPACHMSANESLSRDADMVSGMLNAIQSFVHEAFSADEFDGLNTLQVGELSVWIEWGPSAVLAAVIRGTAPQHLRESLGELLEQIHERYRYELGSYQGQTSLFDPLKPELLQFIDTHDGSLKSRFRSMAPQARRWLFGAAFAVVALSTWIVCNLVDANRWEKFVQRVKAEPGIVVTDHHHSFRDYYISGLQDPLARSLSLLLHDSPIEAERVTSDFALYHDMQTEFVVRRAVALLQPPAGVKLSLDGTTLLINGTVDDSWATEAGRLATQVAGVEKVIFTRKEPMEDQ